MSSSMQSVPSDYESDPTTDYSHLCHHPDGIDHSYNLDEDDDAVLSGLGREAIPIGAWILSFKTLHPSVLLREQIEQLRINEGPEPRTRLALLDGAKTHTLDICVGSLRIKRLAPSLLPQKNNDNTVNIDIDVHPEEMGHFLVVLENYLLLNDISLHDWPPIFLALTKKCGLLPLHYAHMELLLDCTTDSWLRLPAFLHTYDYVLQMLGDSLPRLFWGHIARRIVLEYDPILCSVDYAPMLWTDYSFHRENGDSYSNVWQLLHHLDLVQVMLNYAIGLRSRYLGDFFHFVVNKGLHGTRDDNRYITLLENVEWRYSQLALDRCISLTKSWPRVPKKALKKSMGTRLSLEKEKQDSFNVTFKVTFERMECSTQIMNKECGATLSKLHYVVKALVVENKFFIELSLWRQEGIKRNQHAELEDAEHVFVGVAGLECDCLCEMGRMEVEKSDCSHWPINKRHEKLTFTHRHPKKRLLLMKSVEEEWFQFHSNDCSLMLNVAVREIDL
ncbi:unnamed protein product [Agarophyton chilense]